MTQGLRNNSDGISRRRVLQGVGLTSMGLLAGCEEPPPASLPKHVEDVCKHNARLKTGESLGVRYHSEQWKVTVSNIHPDDTIDITVEKVLVDEENTNSRVTFERTGIKQNDEVRIEDDFRIWYIQPTDEGAWVCVGGTYLNRCSESDDCERKTEK